MSDDSNLAQGSWADAEAMVGQTVSKIEGIDPVSAADIRRKLEVVGLDCPLHYEESAAQAQGYRTLISPACMMRTWVTPAYWSPGEPLTEDRALFPPIPIALVPGPGDRMFATGTKTEYLAPVHPGDRLTATAVLKSVTRKSISVGDGAFMVLETTYTNQDEEAVARDELTVFRFQDKEPSA
jgi:acyl dehydratase